MGGPDGPIGAIDDTDADPVIALVEQIGEVGRAVDKGREEGIDVVHAVAANVFSEQIPLGRNPAREVRCVP